MSYEGRYVNPCYVIVLKAPMSYLAPVVTASTRIIVRTYSWHLLFESETRIGSTQAFPELTISLTEDLTNRWKLNRTENCSRSSTFNLKLNVGVPAVVLGGKFNVIYRL